MIRSSYLGQNIFIFRPGQAGVYVRLSMYYAWIGNVTSGKVAAIGQPLQVSSLYCLCHKTTPAA